MNFFQAFYPDEYVDNVYQIDFSSMYQTGVRNLIFDIDNTLALHGQPADERIVILFEKLHRIGFHTCLLSNNQKKRVEFFANQVRSRYIFKANKPRISGYIRAIDLCNGKKEETVFIGDQLFTDIWGAKRTGIRNILVKPINPREEIQIVIKRFFEKIVLHELKKQANRSEPNYDIQCKG